MSQQSTTTSSRGPTWPSCGERKRHEGHEGVWDGSQPWVGIELPRSRQVGTPAQKTSMIHSVSEGMRDRWSKG